MAQSPPIYNPGFYYVPPSSTTWGAGGNTRVVTDSGIMSNSIPVVIPTSVYAGRWYITSITPTSSTTDPVTGIITENKGTFTLNSTSSESSGVTFSYTLI